MISWLWSKNCVSLLSKRWVNYSVALWHVQLMWQQGNGKLKANCEQDKSKRWRCEGSRAVRAETQIRCGTRTTVRACPEDKENVRLKFQKFSSSTVAWCCAAFFSLHRPSSCSERHCMCCTAVNVKQIPCNRIAWQFPYSSQSQCVFCRFAQVCTMESSCCV